MNDMPIHDLFCNVDPQTSLTTPRLRQALHHRWSHSARYAMGGRLSSFPLWNERPVDKW